MENTADVRRIHMAADEYSKTPLVKLNEIAAMLGVRAVYVKDESQRFGLKAFKGLGGLYALFRTVCDRLGLDPNTTSFEDLKSEKLRPLVSKMVFVTATDGNHGKGVAWAAAKLGCSSHVYMPKGSVEVRAQAIRDAGNAEVVITDLSYDDAVRLSNEKAEKYGWILVQDTSWDGYEDIPSYILKGYTTMAHEAADQLDEQGAVPTHVFLQAGVGAMAGGVTGYLRSRYVSHPPVITTVEPTEVACIFESAAHSDGKPYAATGNGETIMAGLNCGEPCTIGWNILRDHADFYVKCPDWVSAHGMRMLSREGVVSGESGAVTAGLVSMLSFMEFADIKEKLGLNSESVVLLFSTEGDTDPANYGDIVFGNKYPVPELD